MFRFQHPEYLLLLFAVPMLVLIFAALLFWRARIMKAIGEASLVAAQMLGRIPGRITLRAILVLTALLLAIVGAANLQGGGKPEQVQRKGVDVLIALDVSKSMWAQDLTPNRLTRAKQLIERLLDKLHNDRVGLIIFAGKAYLQVPLTMDYNSMRMMLQNAGPDQVPTQGTVIGEAIALAMKSFSQKEKKFKSLIIISDGEDHDEQALAKAKEAADAGVVIHTVGVGSAQGALLFDPVSHQPKLDQSGNQVRSKLNQEEMKQLADAGNGTYQLLGNGAEVASKLTAQIDGMEGRALGSISYTDYDSYFQYFLLPALLLLILEYLIPGATNHRKWNTA